MPPNGGVLGVYAARAGRFGTERRYARVVVCGSQHWKRHHKNAGDTCVELIEFNVQHWFLIWD